MRKGRDRENEKKNKYIKKSMMFIVATNVVASRLPHACPKMILVHPLGTQYQQYFGCYSYDVDQKLRVVFQAPF